MSASAPAVMSVNAFKQATSQPRRRRGRVSWIDTALAAWNNGGCPANQNIPRLIAILTESHRWIAAKQGKNSALNTRRRAAVNQLMKQVWARLQYEKFQAKKSGGARNHIRGLQGTYAHERTTYLASGKSTAISASSAHEIVQLARPLGIQNPPTFDTLSVQAFEQLVRTYSAELPGSSVQVGFYDKQTRIGRMAVPWGGLLHGPNGSPFDTKGVRWAYAVNEYGVLITAPAGRGNGLSASQRFNHSTLNAGKNVISAGILEARSGRLTYIDNASGHYKPRRSDLVAALHALEDDDYDFKAYACEVRVMEQLSGTMGMSVFNNARTLLANGWAKPDRRV